jgi:membrane-bound serine protease (ClpP class)
MTVFFIAILLLFGITLIVLEVLVLPGLVAGILGGVFMLMGIAWTWQIYGLNTAIIVGTTSVILLLVTLFLSLRSGIWGRFSLKDKLEGKMNVIDPEKIKVGDKGAAISSLRPMGTVRINGERYEALSEGVLIPPNYPVEVVRIEGYKIIVKPVE